MPTRARLARALSVLVIGAFAIGWIIPYLRLPAPIAFGAVIVSFILTLSWLLPAWRLPSQRPRAFLIPALLLLLGLILLLPFSFMREAFGTGDVGNLLMTLSENRAPDMLAVGFDGFASTILRYLAMLGLIAAAGYILSASHRIHRNVIAIVALATLSASPISRYLFELIVPNPLHASIAPASSVVPPEILHRPAQKKNVIIFYLESLERNYRDLPATREAFAALADLENRGLALTNIGQVSGTNFTSGGIVASQCGVPLVPRGVFSVDRQNTENADKLPEFKDFLTSTQCLGDLLGAEGYATSYLNGSDLAIYSKGAFFQSHGYQRVRGLSSFEGWENEPRRNIWGMNDDLLFERLTDELRRLAAAGQPFLLSTLTLATHGPDAYLSQDCAPAPEGESNIPPAIACTGRRVQAFLAEIDRLGLSENTVILIQSDHLAFRNTLDDALSEMEDSRRNFVTILGAGQTGQIERAGAMIDVYPTLLELLGYRLRDGKANMGQSLLSPAPTLVERFGVEDVSTAFSGNVELQRRLWLE
ncbi:sulfatase-like hydrolase/transferase [Pseudothioclava arenosa]|uniref:sulfatase-like hydrolase/transferase n=1 Tax=Pseudothioclava arenosa TaxID=1795308 RepID=UPI0015C6B01E|nr:sulfatase-like hydrolase/transferase [Pseudothioclava arenosa]